MALPVAMALSGINQEYFSDGLFDLFHHGAVLLKSPSSSSIASSTTTQESGISSMCSNETPPIAKNLRPYFDLLYKTEIRLQVKNINTF